MYDSRPGGLDPRGESRVEGAPGDAARARRLSPLDAAFLYFERPNQLLQVGCIALLESAVPFDRLAATLGERLGSLRRYRQRPVRPLLDLDRPVWEEDPAFDVRRHVRHVTVPSPGGEAAFHALVDALFATPFDRGHPLWESYLIEGLGQGRAALLTKVHHCMIDGVSGAQVLDLVTDRTAEEMVCAAGPAARWRAAPPGQPPQGFVGWLREAAELASSPSRLWGHARQGLGAAELVTSFLRDPAPRLPFNGMLSDARRLLGATFALDDFFAMRGAAGCKVNDVVLAVIAGALRRYLEARGVAGDGLRVRALVPVSVRREREHLVLGNLVTAMFASLPVGIADPLERLRCVAAEMRRLKEEGQAQAFGFLLGVAGALPAPFGPLLGRLDPARPLVNTICTNVPGPREVRYLLGRRILEIQPIVPLGLGIGLGFAILSYAGRLSIGISADPHLVPDAERIPMALHESAAELRARLGARATVPDPRATVGSSPGSSPAPAAGVRVRALMSREVVTIAPQESLARAYHVMRLRRIRHLPVVDGGGQVIGMVTHRDLLAASGSSLARAGDPLRWLARARALDVMETHVSTAAPDESAADAGRRMVRHKIGCLPVVEDGRLVGIVTEEDFLVWATERMQSVSAETPAG